MVAFWHNNQMPINESMVVKTREVKMPVFWFCGQVGCLYSLLNIYFKTLTNWNTLLGGRARMMKCLGAMSYEGQWKEMSMFSLGKWGFSRQRRAIFKYLKCCLVEEGLNLLFVSQESRTETKGWTLQNSKSQLNSSPWAF